MLWGHEEVSVDEALEIITPPKARKRKAPETETEGLGMEQVPAPSQTKAPLTFTSRRAKLAKEKGLKKPKKTKAKVPTGVPKANTTVDVEPEAEVTVASTSLAIVPEVAVTVLDVRPPIIILEEEVSPVGGDESLRRSKRIRRGGSSSTPVGEGTRMQDEPAATTDHPGSNVGKEPLEDEGVAVQDELPLDDEVTILNEMPFRGETSTPVAGDLSHTQTRLDDCLLRVSITCCSLVY
jgi:hypothetical protein